MQGKEEMNSIGPTTKPSRKLKPDPDPELELDPLDRLVLDFDFDDL